MTYQRQFALLIAATTKHDRSDFSEGEPFDLIVSSTRCHERRQGQDISARKPTQPHALHACTTHERSQLIAGLASCRRCQ